MTGELPPPGWFDDPEGPGVLRWWDGAVWTDHRYAPTGAAVGTPGAPWQQQGGHAAFAMPAPGWWRRVGATVIDNLLVMFVAFVLGYITYAIAGDDVGFRDSGTVDGEFYDDAYRWWEIVGFGSALLLGVLYQWLWLGIDKGRTIGRRAMGLRVVRLDGSPIRPGMAFVREILVKGLLWAFYIPGIISSLWPLKDEHQRALHDIMCGTRVVSTRGDDGATTATSNPFGQV